MTRTEIIDETVEFYKKNPRSINSNGKCFYKGPNGKQCAFQRVVETNLSPYEGCIASHIIEAYLILFKEEYRGYENDGGFWRNIQIIHDMEDFWDGKEFTKKGEDFIKALKKCMKTKNLVIGAVFLLLGIIIVGGFISTSNREIDLRTTFNQKIDERTAFYDKMWKTISQNTQIAVRNDSAFRSIVNAQVQGQKLSDNAVFAWVQQSNPAASFGEVSKLYQDLGRAVEANRESFFQQEKTLQDVKREHDKLLKSFPSTVYLSILGREPLQYKPITSDRTERVIQSGKDNEVNLF